MRFTTVMANAFMAGSLFLTLLLCIQPVAACDVTSISILNLSPAGIRFGTMLPLSGGTVTLAPDDSRSSTGVALLPSCITSAAHFQVSGSAYYSFSIVLPASTTISSGANSMRVDTFKSSPSGYGVLDRYGNRNLDIGATLHVNSGQPIGNYSGIYSVTVAYN